MKTICLGIFVITFAITAAAQDVSLDKKLGAENAKLVESEMGIYQHDSLNRLINEIGAKLVSQLKDNPFEFKFFLADTPIPNAFALPGGYIYVTRGILPFIQTEDELAGIMAHEIIHVAQRHSVKQIKKSRIGSIFQIPGNLVNAVTGTRVGNVLNVPLGLASQGFIASYSRGHEKESDKLGIQLAAQSGYDPNALAAALTRLAKGVEILTGAKEKKNYFSDHPITSSRVGDINKSAASLTPTAVSSGKESPEMFQQRFNGLCFGANPSGGMFIEDQFIHPDLNFSWNVPLSWVKDNRPSAAGAYAKQGDAAIVLSTVPGERSAHDVGEKVKSNVMKSPEVGIAFAKDTTIHSNKAYAMGLRARDQTGDLYVELVWVDYAESVFQLAGISRLPKRDSVHRALVSFRKSSTEDLTKVVKLELHYVHPAQTETIGQLSERTQNKLDLPMTSLINDVDKEKPLPESVMVKIIQAVPYKKGM